LGDVEVNDPSSIMAEEDQGVEKPKRRSCNDEYVDRDNRSEEKIRGRSERCRRSTAS
jgi:hypothetical protein